LRGRVGEKFDDGSNVVSGITEQEAADFVAWVRTNYSSVSATRRDFYAADGSFAGRYVEIRGHGGRVRLWSSKKELLDALKLWRQVFLGSLFIVAVGGFLIGVRTMPSAVAGIVCVLVGFAGMVRIYLWQLWRYGASAR
jgi:hypothetical protein